MVKTMFCTIKLCSNFIGGKLYGTEKRMQDVDFRLDQNNLEAEYGVDHNLWAVVQEDELKHWVGAEKNKSVWTEVNIAPSDRNSDSY